MKNIGMVVISSHWQNPEEKEMWWVVIQDKPKQELIASEFKLWYELDWTEIVKITYFHLLS